MSLGEKIKQKFQERELELLKLFNKDNDFQFLGSDVATVHSLISAMNAVIASIDNLENRIDRLEKK